MAKPWYRVSLDPPSITEVYDHENKGLVFTSRERAVREIKTYWHDKFVRLDEQAQEAYAVFAQWHEQSG